MNIFLTGAFFLSYGKNVRYISVRFCEYLKIRVAAMRAFFGAHYCAPFLICQFGTVRPYIKMMPLIWQKPVSVETGFCFTLMYTFRKVLHTRRFAT